MEIYYNEKPAFTVVIQDEMNDPQTPRLALVLDDAGYENKMVDGFLALEIPLTFAVIPGLSGSIAFSGKAKKQGYAVILHQPMEPMGKEKLDDSFIKTGMDDRAVKAIITHGLRTVPGATGLNNHMGSKATADPRLMSLVMDELAVKNLYFVDSYTSSGSVAFQEALKRNVPALQRDIFIDNERDIDKILKQLHKAVLIARRRKIAVAIGHVTYSETLAALRLFKNQLPGLGIQLVTTDQILLERREDSGYRNQL